MIPKSKISDSFSKRTGLTLIEVAAATALLATLLVSVLVSYGGIVRQIKRSKEKLEAAAFADQLLRGLVRSSPAPTSNQLSMVRKSQRPITQGQQSGKEGRLRKGFRYQICAQENRDLQEQMCVQVMRLEIYPAVDADDSASDNPLVVVEYLAPMPFSKNSMELPKPHTVASHP